MKAATAVAGLVLASLLAVELLLSPDAGERLVFAGAFAGSALAAWAAAAATARVPGRSLRVTLLAPALAAVAVAVGTAVAASALMFISPHDLRVILVSLALGAGLAVVTALLLEARLGRDLRAMASTAQRAAGGDLSVRTHVGAPGEIGDVARALDRLLTRLADAEGRREQVEAARRRLFVSLGHDLRTPLTALRVAVEALGDGVAPDPDRYLGSMRADIAALDELISDLFLLARMEAGDLQPAPEALDLAEIADEAAEALGPVAAARQVTLEVAAAGPVAVVGGARELARAVRNLLDNAVRHTPARSRVRVEVSNGGPTASLVVVDQGPGFAGDGDDPFAPFVTADAARRDGTGLGLAIVRGVAAAHGGEARIEPGPGGRVAMRLPAAPAQYHT